MKRTPLYQAHVDADARMVEFAGYEMPVQYPMGVKKEHLWTREAAGLFDVSHMGQVIIRGANVKSELEALLPVDVKGLGLNQQRYGVFTTTNGGISDDLMFTNWGEQEVYMVVNAACKEADVAHMKNNLPTCDVEVVDRALVALQGPKAREAATKLIPEAKDLLFMQSTKVQWQGHELWVSCSGYTGEDGYEISVPNDVAEAFCNALTALEEVEWIGLGARDSLRLEAGLCLYGHDLDQSTTPVEGSITWAIQKVRRAGGEREGNFVGADVILGQFANGVSRKRVGFLVEGKAPVREGVEVVTEDGQLAGKVTSGGFAPSLGQPIVMAYVQTEFLEQPLFASLRGKMIPLTSAKMPFFPSRYYRG
ncbi:glycine cleavage system aminomethyltransferase GcvT [Marinomonas ostreistagni]|uniref:glycine cleavage system aminomethyltransferase GcvT n=1 Tax=Marinomonas ostreistagni TaxID=359209 RepID=UPI00194FB3D0|nr:glycine cleavage system aminomethyltransferase GcvT [Marinomonas ostreistagni]MBM6550297.1 glycine cleavage system aminomethyltransferase GcvT [Marinomonas ostreistagni]